MRYFEPNFLDEALVLLDRFGDKARVLAGGTLLGPKLRSAALDLGSRADGSGDALINIKRIDELSAISIADGRLRIGALATAADLATNELVAEHAPLVAKAAASLGARQLRSVATIGGNICSGHPAADLSAALLASDAICEISSIHEGPSTLPVERFFRDGSNALRTGELVLALTVGADGRAAASYRKMATRRAFEMALVSVAVWLRTGGGSIAEARIALGGAATRPIRATAAEAALIGGPLDAQTIRHAATVAAQADAAPVDDVRASADYRRHLVAILTERALFDVQRAEAKA